tara:strand:- start:538 stop:2922 length:2385 start_codon:yes stop_codon:yes gene_type:complete
MINKIKYLILLLIFCANSAQSQEQLFNFKTKSIEVIDNGNIINAKNGKAISNDKNLEIIADNFQYLDKTKILRINGNAEIFINSNQLKITFEKGIVNQNELTFEAFGKIEAEDLNKKLRIYSKKIIFNNKDEVLFSPFESIIEDGHGNKLIVDNFNYELQKDLLKVNNLNFTDKNNNILKSSVAYINTKSNNLYGKDVFVNLDNKTLNENNEPRLKGNSIIDNVDNTEITKGVFTTCKKRDGCPPWELSAEKIIHDKKKRLIKYENAYLKIYDKTIAYFPSFHHPDPTVERETGFLTPSFKNSSNRKNFLSLPYFLVIADNKDATFSPRFYDHEEIFLQTEYRQANYKSDHISDFSFKIDKDKKLKSHFFYKYNKDFNLDNFIESNFDFKIQTTSKDTYLRKNNIKSELINDETLLENSAKISLYKNDISMNFETIVYENLNESNSDRFEYIMPKINLTKKIDNKTSLNGSFTLNSQALAKNYDTNVFEKVNINDLAFKSLPNITEKGFYNNYEFIIKNSNSDAQNSTTMKNKENIFLSGLIQFNSSLPLINENENYQKVLNPKLALKLAPTYTKDIRKEDNKIDINNIYSLNRAGQDDTIEGGISLTYGNDFSILNKKDSREIFSFKVANNLRLEENDDLPGNSQIGKKTSSILNEILIQPNEIIKISYNSSIKNNIKEINHENLITELKINNLVTNFDYLNQNESVDKNSYLTYTTKYLVDESNSLSFSSRKNKTIDLTEYYKLSYQYKNDCLSASIEYDKEYYSDRDIKPNESLFFKLTIIPFNKKKTSDL